MLYKVPNEQLKFTIHNSINVPHSTRYKAGKAHLRLLYYNIIRHNIRDNILLRDIVMMLKQLGTPRVLSPIAYYNSFKIGNSQIRADKEKL